MSSKKQIVHKELRSVISNLDRLSRGTQIDSDIFKLAFETSPIGVALVSPDGTFQEINPALSQMFGYAVTTLKKKTFQELTYPEDLEKDLALLKKTLKGDIETYQMNKRYVHKDKHIIWARLSLAAIRDEGGEVRVFVSQIADISESVEYERELELQKNEYQALTENTSDMISKHKADGTYTYVNPACKELLGYLPQEMVGSNAYDYFHPGDLVRIRSHHQKNREKEGLNDEPIDYRLRRKDGSFVWVQTRSRGILSGGKLVSIIAVTRDMEKTVKEMKIIEEKERKYRLLLNNLPLRVFYKNRKSIYQSCNATYANDLGIDPEKIVGRSDADFFPPQYVKKFQADDARVVQTGERFEDIEDYVVGKKEMRIHTIKVPITENNSIIGLLGIFWDISQEDILQKENRKQIEQLEKLNKFFTNRELRMIELKKENAELRRKLESQT